jgi:acyl-CoA thioesterase-1
MGAAVLFAAPEAQARTLVVEAFGDSLFAGYGLQAADAFPARLQAALQRDGLDAKVIAGSVSGDTIADGVQRVDWMLQDHPDLVIVELGGNDVLRGLPPAQARAGLTAICDRLAAAHIRFILAGMMAPGNLGPQYASEFDAIYPDLAKKYGVPLYPFVLQSVIFHPDLMQADGIHPNVTGEQVMVRGLLPLVEAELKKAG